MLEKDAKNKLDIEKKTLRHLEGNRRKKIIGRYNKKKDVADDRTRIEVWG